MSTVIHITVNFVEVFEVEQPESNSEVTATKVVGNHNNNALDGFRAPSEKWFNNW